MIPKPEVDDTGYGNIKKLVGNPVGELLLDDDGRSPNASKYAYLSVDSIWGRISYIVSNNAIIADFGKVFESSTPLEILKISTFYGSPRWLFGKQVGAGSDL